MLVHVAFNYPESPWLCSFVLREWYSMLGVTEKLMSIERVR